MQFIILCAMITTLVSAFRPTGMISNRISITSSRDLKMEYIPDGLSKEQWKKMKEEEAKKNEGKDLGKVGITKFKSRSFEAWQKDGQKHLYPVDPSVPRAEKPYMQRTGGVWDGRDLKGEKAKGQAAPMKFTEVDAKYEKLEKAGLLVSSPWANKKPEEPVVKNDKKTAAVPAAKRTAPAEEPKKKGFFGLF